MENQTPQKQTLNSQEKLSNLTLEQSALLLPILTWEKIERQNNFLLLTVEEWQWIRDEIVKDFPNLTIGELDLIISNGVKGYYDNSKYPININATTIFRWIKKYSTPVLTSHHHKNRVKDFRPRSYHTF